MGEAVAAILEFGFKTLNATCIEAAHATWNRASGRVLQKAGMKFSAHVPQGFQKRGEWVAEDRFEIVKAVWIARQ